MIHMGNFGIGGLLILIADIYAVLNILQAPIDNLKKAVWVALVVALPLAGFLLWLFLGPRGRGFS